MLNSTLLLRGSAMLVFGLFAVCIIAVGLLVAKVYEWRQDVLYGPYLPRDPSDRA
jgi:hypothetical protein